MEVDVSCFLLYLETRKSLKDQKSYDKYGAYYLLVKNRAKLKMYRALENSEIEF